MGFDKHAFCKHVYRLYIKLKLLTNEVFTSVIGDYVRGAEVYINLVLIKHVLYMLSSNVLQLLSSLKVSSLVDDI